MNKPPHNDDDIDAWLDRREPLFRRSRAEDELEPPDEIDNVVLARARSALRESNPHAERRSPLPAFFTLDQWALPLGLAATLIIAVAVVIQVNPDEAALAGRVQDIDTPAARAEEADAAPVAAPITDEAMTNAVEPTSQAAMAKPSAPAPARSDAAPARVQPDPVAVAPQAAADATAPVAAAVPSDIASDFAAPPPAPAAPPAVAGQAAAAKTVPTERRALAVPSMMGASESAAGNVQDLRADPAAWYQRIQTLRNAGQTDAAEREWRELKARYPEFDPPAENVNAPRP